MSIDFQNGFNPNDAEFLRFLSGNPNLGDSVTLTSDKLLAATKMSSPAWRVDPGRVREIKLPSAVRIHCRLREFGMDIGKFTFIHPAETVVELSSSTKLGIRVGTSTVHQEAIVAAFAGYTFTADGSLPAYIATL